MSLRRLLLVALNLALLAAFWPAIDRPAPVGAPAASALVDRAPPPVPDAPRPPDPPDTGRPLFRSRLQPAEPVETPPEAESRPSVRLSGIVLMEDRRVALVEHGETMVRVAEGDELDGWEVTAIEPRAIRLTRAEQQVEVPLDPPVDEP